MRRALVAAITLVGGAASAHVAPSVDDNNRYLKLTPQADRVRLAYTVFFGEVPGGQMRPSLDTDRDGLISDAEAAVFGKKLAAEVAAGLDVSVDHVQHRLAWAEVIVGTGSPTVTAGSFSVDMIAYFCLASIGGHHEVLVRDRFRLPRPGETEVKIDDGIGIKITTARVGPADDPTHDYKFVGPGGPLSDDGIELAFDVADGAPRGTGACASVAAAPAEPVKRKLSTGLVVGVAAVLGFVLAAIVAIVRRRRAN
ncbi:MAG: hypothetical protein ABI867_29910 [Kofleriaceae bacterium]